VATSEQDLRSLPDTGSPPTLQTVAAGPDDGRALRIEPDLGFIRALDRAGGVSFKRCMQCGTCSATCDISPDHAPFPGKEMAWSSWGLKDRLLADPDVWLCYQCQDCSARCPRGARPGDVLGAVREACIRHYAVPRFLGRWVNEPHCIPLILGIPAALLALALVARDPVERALGISHEARDRIVFAYSSKFPHWLLNTFFAFFGVLALLAMIAGVRRFWRALKEALPTDRPASPIERFLPSLVSTLKGIFRHEKFDQCTKTNRRFFSHVFVLFGFLALTFVTAWVITARYNPLIQGDFIYPFPIWSPWKILANLGGGFLVVGCLLMLWDRLRENGQAVGGGYFDYAFLVMLLCVAVTGFVTELLHYLRLEPHRHVAYFVHLVFVFVILMYLPYSKFAHMVYRATALVFVRRYRPTPETSAVAAAENPVLEQGGTDHA
jgi:quinone-modifying oxidoreductase subunit QmoC